MPQNFADAFLGHQIHDTTMSITTKINFRITCAHMHYVATHKESNLTTMPVHPPRASLCCLGPFDALLAIRRRRLHRWSAKSEEARKSRQTHAERNFDALCCNTRIRIRPQRPSMPPELR